MKLLLTTCNPDQAQPLLRQLLEERLVGCGNCLPEIRSLYWWDGEIQEEREVMLIMETPDHRSEAAFARLRALHPYEVPKIVQIDAQAVDADYLRWLTSVTAA